MLFMHIDDRVKGENAIHSICIYLSENKYIQQASIKWIKGNSK